MTLVNDLRKSVTDTTPVYVVVGATDLAVEKVRAVRDLARVDLARIERARADLARVDAKQLSQRAQRVPTAAVTLTLEAAGRAEEAYDDLAVRGKQLVDRLRRQRATQDLLAQGKVTLSRGKAAVTTVRRGGADTRTAAKATVTTARHEAADVADDTRASVQKRTAGTKAAAKRTSTTATTRAARAKSTTKATGTGARKTAAAARKAAAVSAEKIGD